MNVIWIIFFVVAGLGFYIWTTVGEMKDAVQASAKYCIEKHDFKDDRTKAAYTKKKGISASEHEKLMEQCLEQELQKQSAIFQ